MIKPNLSFGVLDNLGSFWEEQILYLERHVLILHDWAQTLMQELFQEENPGAHGEVPVRWRSKPHERCIQEETSKGRFLAPPLFCFHQAVHPAFHPALHRPITAIQI